MEKRERLAREILTMSRNTLMVHLRFLDLALSQFEWIPVSESTMLTDGKHLLFNPLHVLRSYKTAKEIPVRDFLHMVMHCVFRHMDMDPNLERPYWDLACDIAVENTITELGLQCVATFRESKQLPYLSAVKKDLNHATAEKIYAYLRQTHPDPVKVAEIRSFFYADDHEIWYMSPEEVQSRFEI